MMRSEGVEEEGCGDEEGGSRGGGEEMRSVVIMNSEAIEAVR